MDTISEDLDHERKGSKQRCEIDLTSVHDIEHPSKRLGDSKRTRQ
jgi:hypothetical protein